MTTVAPPRTWAEMSAGERREARFEKIPPFTDLWEVVLVSGHMVPFGLPEVQDALRALVEAGNRAMAWVQMVAAFDREARGLGYPNVIGGFMISFGTAMDEGKADTVHAMIDFTKEYGVYG